MNFNKSGSSQKTTVGGVFSMGIKLFLFAYIALKLVTLLVTGDPKLNTFKETVTYDLNAG